MTSYIEHCTFQRTVAKQIQGTANTGQPDIAKDTTMCQRNARLNVVSAAANEGMI